MVICSSCQRIMACVLLTTVAEMRAALILGQVASAVAHMALLQACPTAMKQAYSAAGTDKACCRVSGSR